VVLTFLVLLAWRVLGDTSDYIYGLPVIMQVILTLPLAAVAILPVSLTYTAPRWRAAAAGLTARMHQIVLLLGLTVFVVFAYSWDLIGWQG
jgi:hypothetical protein